LLIVQRGLNCQKPQFMFEGPCFYSHSVYTVVENLDGHREREKALSTCKP
jgi:hypothetical protein